MASHICLTSTCQNFNILLQGFLDLCFCLVTVSLPTWKGYVDCCFNTLWVPCRCFCSIHYTDDTFVWFSHLMKRCTIVKRSTPIKISLPYGERAKQDFILKAFCPCLNCSTRVVYTVVQPAVRIVIIHDKETLCNHQGTTTSTASPTHQDRPAFASKASCKKKGLFNTQYIKWQNRLLYNISIMSCIKNGRINYDYTTFLYIMYTS